MPDSKLELIRKYCDTTGVHLGQSAKKLLCKVLENPDKYNGFTSELRVAEKSGRDYRDTWDSTTKWQYRIIIDSGLSIVRRFWHACDGYVQDEHWDWNKASHITNIKEIIQILEEIGPEL